MHNVSEENVYDFFFGNLDFKKEQFNEKEKSLEAIGDIADDPDENQDAPMDEEPEEENPDDEGGEPTEPAEDDPENPDDPGTPEENPDDDEGGPEEEPDQEEEPEEKVIESEATNAFENRKILISNYIIKLFKAIEESIQNISDSNSANFDKPVTLQELTELKEGCMLLNGELNKVQDHNIILGRYGVMVKTFQKIIARRIDKNEKKK